MRLKITAYTILVISLMHLVIPTLSFAQEGILIDTATAKKLVTDLTLSTNTIKYYEEKIPLLEQQRDMLQKANELNQNTIRLLQEDKELYRLQSEQFKAEYIKSQTELNEEKESRPSRTTWFGSGFILGLAAGLAGTFMLTK